MSSEGEEEEAQSTKPQLVAGINERLDLDAVERLRQRKAEESLLPPEVDAKQAALLGNGAKKVPRCGKCTRPLEEDAIEAKQLVCNRCKSGTWERPGVALEKKREAKRIRDAGSVSAVKDDSLWEQPVCGGGRVAVLKEDEDEDEDETAAQQTKETDQGQDQDDSQEQKDDHDDDAEPKERKRRDSHGSGQDRSLRGRKEVLRCTVCTRPLKDEDDDIGLKCVSCLEKVHAAGAAEREREQKWSSSWDDSRGGGSSWKDSSWKDDRGSGGWSGGGGGGGGRWSRDDDDNHGYGSGKAGKGGKGKGSSWGNSNSSWDDNNDWGSKNKNDWGDWKPGGRKDWDKKKDDWEDEHDWDDKPKQRGWNSGGYKNDWNSSRDEDDNYGNSGGWGKGGGKKGGGKRGSDKGGGKKGAYHSSSDYDQDW